MGHMRQHMQSALHGSGNLEGSGLQGPSETRGTSRWHAPQMGINGRMSRDGKDRGRGSSGPEIFWRRQGWLALLLWLQGPHSPTAAPSLLASHRLGPSYLRNGVGFLLVGGEFSGGGGLANMLGTKTAEKGLEDVTATRLLRRGLGHQA